MSGADFRYRYGRWHGGPDPLAAPFDLREALDEIGRDVMEGSSPRGAVRELLRRGLGGEAGLDDLSRRLWKKRQQLRKRFRGDGTLDQVRQLLNRALDAERGQLARQDGDDARFRELRLDALPDDTGGAVRELSEYDWQSSDAREAYQEIRDLLGREMLEQRFRGIKQAMQQVSGEDKARVASMLADLNSLLAAHAAGADDIQQRFDEFMRRHGRFFPENPRNVDELIDALASRSAAAQRLMNSLSAEQQAELAELAQQAFGGSELSAQLAQLDARLRGLRPGEDWDGTGGLRGNNPLGLGEATEVMEQLGQLDSLSEQLAQSYPGARLEDIDLEALERQLGPRAAVDARRLAELERELERQGLFERAPDGTLRLSPAAMRRLGQTALRDVVDRLGGRHGERDTRRAGAAGEPTGATRPWAFGDTETWDVPRTLTNALLRSSGPAAADRPVHFDITDVEVTETEQRSRAAVALCVDVSYSMIQDGRWLPMKQTALALHHLVKTRFRSDALQLITFGRYAQQVSPEELVGLEGSYEKGTNLHHALLLAGRHLRRHPDAAPVLLVVTDGEPTAHLEPDGEALFNYPTTQETVRITLAELDGLTRLGTALTVFMLGEDPSLRDFMDLVARRSGGRVVAPDPDGLGAAVVGDYLRYRRRR
jgi:uncharacterized protein with von Willebrand factor type A (vWA) domain